MPEDKGIICPQYPLVSSLTKKECVECTRRPNLNRECSALGCPSPYLMCSVCLAEGWRYGLNTLADQTANPRTGLCRDHALPPGKSNPVFGSKQPLPRPAPTVYPIESSSAIFSRTRAYDHFDNRLAAPRWRAEQYSDTAVRPVSNGTSAKRPQPGTGTPRRRAIKPPRPTIAELTGEVMVVPGLQARHASRMKTAEVSTVRLKVPKKPIPAEYRTGLSAEDCTHVWDFYLASKSQVKGVTAASVASMLNLPDASVQVLWEYFISAETDSTGK